ncbi:MAG: tRNA pseudouridine(38-40) synthase TruA [Pseudomonadota bacterium]
MSTTPSQTRRYAAGVAYDGSAFAGFQLQRGQRTVQGALEAALGHVADRPVRVIGSGRTDSGVHAGGQVIHFDSDAERPDHAWLLGTNTQLDDDVALRWLRPVAADFHARFSAEGRRYRYRIVNQPTRPVLRRSTAAWVRDPLNAAAMHVAGQALVGEHDFSSFRAAACQATHPVRQINSLAVTRLGNDIAIVIEGNAFLHHMVRNITGALLAVGRGECDAAWLVALLAARDRTQGAATAHARGLTLEAVRYGSRWNLPAVATSGAAR